MTLFRYMPKVKIFTADQNFFEFKIWSVIE